MVKAGKPAKVAIVAMIQSSSSSPTPSSVISENGPQLTLDEHGHYSCRVGKDRSPRERRHSIAEPEIPFIDRSRHRRSPTSRKLELGALGTPASPLTSTQVRVVIDASSRLYPAGLIGREPEVTLINLKSRRERSQS